MLRNLPIRTRGLALVVAVFAVATLAASCGSGGYAAKPMTLLEFLFVDRKLNPTAPTGTQNLPRNAQIVLVFSERVDPQSVDNQTIQIRFGPTGQSVPKGSFSVDGNTVRFDPTVTAQGQPNPFGFDPATQYTVDVPNYEEQQAVVRNLDADPNLETFFTSFVTSDGYIRELVPPEIVRVYSIPDRFVVNPLTGQWPGNGLMAFEFSEPMDPASFFLGGPTGPDPTTSIDVRYLADEQINIDNGLVGPTGVGLPVPGYFTFDAAATTYFFTPTFSFGDNKFIFASQVFQGLKDLSGNLLVNPRTFGRYTCDGTGIETGLVLWESFESAGNQDFANTDADWGSTEEGILQGQPITSRSQYLYSYRFQGTGSDDVGQYAAVTSPLVGAALNQYVSNVNPPTQDGRRVQLSFSDVEMGADGSLTGAGWGPDSNATFAAIYPKAILRCGYQKKASISLSPSFSGNYDGTPTVLYTGEYRVQQAANVGNTINSGGDPGGYSQGFGCTTITPWNRPLWDSTGFVQWPSFTSFFEWDDGESALEGDRIFVFDASVQEGDTWQQVRTWFAMTFPCSGILIPGYPLRRLYSTYEADLPNPEGNFGLGILNPEPSVCDTCFTITKRVSMAQTLFYTDGTQPTNSAAPTFGKNSDYRSIQLSPSVQGGGALVKAEFQAADAVEADRRTINKGSAYLPDWTESIDACDGYACIRWRIFLISNLITGTRARLSDVIVPVVRND